MNRNIKTIIGILPLFFLIGCTTPPAEKDFLQNRNHILNENSPKLKIYFPTFTTIDEKTKKTRVVNGDGMIIILPDNKCMVIDSFDTESRYDLVDFIKKLGISKIDYLVASHYHIDHIGGMIELINNFEIGAFYSNGVDFNTDIVRKLHKALDDKNLEINVLQEGDFLTLSDGPNPTTIKLFWPTMTPEDTYNAFYNPGKTEKLKNLCSLVFQMKYKEFTVLFTGDIYKDGDKYLTKKYGKQLKSTILKVPHHGEFYTANSPSFVKTVSPEYAVIQDNRYINFVISSIYRAAKAKLLYRNTAGFILIESDGINYSVNEYTF